MVAKIRFWTRSGDIIYGAYGRHRNGRCMRCGWRPRKHGIYCAVCWKKIEPEIRKG